MGQWFVVKKDPEYIAEFLEMFWSFHDFRIKSICYNYESDSVDLILEYDTPDEMNDVLLSFTEIYAIHIDCEVDYEADWISGASMYLTEDGHFIWANSDNSASSEEIKELPEVTYIESRHLHFALIDRDGNSVEFPEEMLHQKWHVVNYETMQYEDINKEFQVFAEDK